ncbi:MAG: hypothetical protein ACI38B_04805 [Bifidobacterium sp.]|uniref:hypothetical protein n=1 Tax=Bifidobacterium sp. TaxID=41200 RepID=UPI003EFBC022
MTRSKASSQEPKPAVDPAAFTGYFQELFDSNGRYAARTDDKDEQFTSVYNEVCDFTTGKRENPGKNTVKLLSKIIENVMKRSKNGYGFRALRDISGDDSGACSWLACEFCYMLTVSGDQTRIPNPVLSRLLLESHSSEELCKKLRGEIPRYLSDRQSMTEYGHIADSVKTRLTRASDTFEMREQIWYLIRFLMSLQDRQRPKSKDNTSLVELVRIAEKLKDIWDPMQQRGGKNLIDRMEEVQQDRKNRGIIPGPSGAPVRERSGKQLRLSGNSKGGGKAPIDRWMEALLDQLNGGLSHWRFADIIVASCGENLIADGSAQHIQNEYETRQYSSNDNQYQFNEDGVFEQIRYDEDEDAVFDMISNNEDGAREIDGTSDCLRRILENKSIQEVEKQISGAVDNPEFIDCLSDIDNIQQTAENLRACLQQLRAEKSKYADSRQRSQYAAHQASQGKD